MARRLAGAIVAPIGRKEVNIRLQVGPVFCLLRKAATGIRRVSPGRTGFRRKCDDNPEIPSSATDAQSGDP